MPCGTGKSLTAYWIAEELKAKTILVAVPSLALVRQSLTDWTREFLAHGIKPDWLCVCSDETVGNLERDEFVGEVYDLGLPTRRADQRAAENYLPSRRRVGLKRPAVCRLSEKRCTASARLGAPLLAFQHICRADCRNMTPFSNSLDLPSPAPEVAGILRSKGSGQKVTPDDRRARAGLSGRYSGA